MRRLVKGLVKGLVRGLEKVESLATDYAIYNSVITCPVSANSLCV